MLEWPGGSRLPQRKCGGPSGYEEWPATVVISGQGALDGPKGME